MKPYLLRNNDEQHQERLVLEAAYKKKAGHCVDYCDILHELQHKAFLKTRARQKE